MFTNTSDQKVMTPPRLPLHLAHHVGSMQEMDLPKNKSAQAAQHLKTLILNGQFGTTLPSERLLSEQLLISRNCLREALSQLTKDGVLEPSSPSKRRKILLTSENSPRSKIQRCIIISPTPEHKAPAMLLSQLASLRNTLLKSNISVEICSTQAFRRKDVDVALTSLINDLPNATWVLHQCPESIQSWFQDQGLPAIIFGSAFPEVTLPCVDADHVAGVRHAASQLIRLGHRHIALLIPRTTLAGAQLAELGLTQALEQTQTDVKYTVLGHDFDIPRLTSKLSSTFRVEDPPTAIIVQNHHHFLTVYSHLMSLGLKIPQHVSLISMTSDPSIERLSPTPTSYSTGTKLLRSLASTITNIRHKSMGNIHILPEFAKGETIAAPPKFK